jgi:hypothetical protein
MEVVTMNPVLRYSLALACFFAPLVVLVVQRGRAGLVAWVNATAGLILLITPPWLLGLAAGDERAGWLALPMCLVAAWFGRSPLGLLNFIVLQWFGVRLQAAFDRERWQDGPRGRWWAIDAPAEGPIAWSLIWVWPLTGWWSPYRKIGGAS